MSPAAYASASNLSSESYWQVAYALFSMLLPCIGRVVRPAGEYSFQSDLEVLRSRYHQIAFSTLIFGVSVALEESLGAASDWRERGTADWTLIQSAV